MSKGIIISIWLITMGISFLIMSVGCIKNKWIVLAGGVLFMVSVVLFLIGFNDVLFT